MLKRPKNKLLVCENYPGLGGGTLKVYAGSQSSSPERLMLTPKQIIARLISEYGDLERAMFNSYSDGICHSCGYIQSGVEPDARGYRCEECGEKEVVGVEETIITLL